MSTVDVDNVVGKINACRKVLKRLESCERPVAPRNDAGKWAEFQEKMGECVRYFDAFNRNIRVDMENLKRAKTSLDEADEKLKAWAGGSAVLYNVDRGVLGPEVVYCKQLIACLLQHVGEVSEAAGEVGAMHTAVTNGVEYQGGGMTQMVQMRGLLSRMQELT